MTKPRKNRAPLNLAMGLIGLGGMIAMTVVGLLDVNTGWLALCLLVVSAAIAIMFFTRKSDEYTLNLWSAAANAAFATVVIVALFGTFAEAVYHGFMEAHDAVRREREVDGDLAAILALYAFFLTFNIKRLLGAF